MENNFLNTLSDSRIEVVSTFFINKDGSLLVNQPCSVKGIFLWYLLEHQFNQEECDTFEVYHVKKEIEKLKLENETHFSATMIFLFNQNDGYELDSFSINLDDIQPPMSEKDYSDFIEELEREYKVDTSMPYEIDPNSLPF